ncbi:MAG TPA: response regulator, partial [Burkholderiaceae bacterium]|nr:response regulator [Burkholderiaceae bacterium]
IAAHELSSAEPPETLPWSPDCDVLVAEDNPVNADLAVEMLASFGLRARVVGNGAEAAKACMRHRFALVFMDAEMPVLDGLAATRAIRINESLTGSRQPIVAMTAHAFDEFAQNCLRAGMDDFLSKPLTLDAIARALRDWLPQHKQAAAQRSSVSS